jgi:hypothetical protein
VDLCRRERLFVTGDRKAGGGAHSGAMGDPAPTRKGFSAHREDGSERDTPRSLTPPAIPGLMTVSTLRLSHRIPDLSLLLNVGSSGRSRPADIDHIMMIAVSKHRGEMRPEIGPQ